MYVSNGIKTSAKDFTCQHLDPKLSFYKIPREFGKGNTNLYKIN